MPRKQRCRWIDAYPDHWAFSPEEASGSEPVVMSLDEFEAIRLLDREGMTQEQCAERMGVARTTVTSIYESARRKMAEALVDGKRLLIRGGNYRLNDQGTENILEKGNLEDADILYRNFRGRDPKPEALLIRDGLTRPLRK